MSHPLGSGPIIAIMILFLSIIILLLWATLSGRSTARPAPTVTANTQPKQLTVDDPVGASTDGNFTLADDGQAYTDAAACKSAVTTIWDQQTAQVHCICANPFFGFNCFRESYDITYFAVGNPSDSDVTVTVIDTVSADRLSFPFVNSDLSGNPVICTQLCDSDVTCTGILWDPPDPPTMGTQQNGEGICTLLSGDVIVNPDRNIPYDINVDSTLYLKGGDENLIFTDRVFLYSGTLPSRYYLRDGVSTDAGGQITPIFEEIVTKLTFIPTTQLNTANLTGIFSDALITDEQIAQIELGNTPSNGQQFFIVNPDTIDLPVFGVSQLWVVYVQSF